MKILISGATGLVGTAIVGLCRARNIEVNYLTTRKNKIKNEQGLKGFYWDPRQHIIDAECFTDVTAIINLAGATIAMRWTPKNKKRILESRISSLQTLYQGLEKLNNHAVEMFVSASAIGRYPNSLTEFYTEDETSVDQSFLGEVVSAWEKEIARFESLNLKVAQIRIGLVLSKAGGALPPMARPIRFFVGSALGAGSQWQSWIHINDLARLFLFVIDHKLKGVYNGVAPNPVTNNKLVKEIAQVLKRPLILPNIPRFVLGLLLGEMSYLLFASHRVSSKRIEAKGFDYVYPNISGALQAIYAKEEKEENSDLLTVK